MNKLNECNETVHRMIRERMPKSQIAAYIRSVEQSFGYRFSTAQIEFLPKTVTPPGNYAGKVTNIVDTPDGLTISFKIDNPEKETKMETRTSDDFDVVTLMQLSSGAMLYRCKFKDTDTKTYTYKSMLRFNDGDFALVKPNDGYGVIVKVVEQVIDIEPGIDYKWIIGRADMSAAREILSMDDKVRRSLSMSRAMKEAEELRVRIGSVSVVPNVLAIEAKSAE